VRVFFPSPIPKLLDDAFARSLLDELNGVSKLRVTFQSLIKVDTTRVRNLQFGTDDRAEKTSIPRNVNICPWSIYDRVQV